MVNNEQNTQTVNKKNWNNRSFVSWLFLMIFSLLVVSGVALYIAPRCRDAEWAGWTFLGMGKDPWEVLHMATGFFGIILAVIHIAYNWSCLMRYVHKLRPTVVFRWREVLAASVISIGLLGLSAAEMPPVTWLEDYHSQRKEAFSKSIHTAPWRNAEKASIDELAEHLNIEHAELLKAFRRAGYSVGPGQSLETIARRYQMAPMQLYIEVSNAIVACDGQGQLLNRGDCGGL